jgi:hypothetical protein
MVFWCLRATWSMMACPKRRNARARDVRIPGVAVLGSHSYEAEQIDELRQMVWLVVQPLLSDAFCRAGLQPARASFKQRVTSMWSDQ